MSVYQMTDQALVINAARTLLDHFGAVVIAGTH